LRDLRAEIENQNFVVCHEESVRGRLQHCFDTSQ
jgi:hypothetical protein